MSVLASLVRAYERLSQRGGMPTFGYATQNIQACIILDRHGDQVGGPALWDRDETGKLGSRPLNVPYFGGRSGSKAPPYFLWDNSAYVLGVSAKENFDAQARHSAFVKYHLEAIGELTDEALQAFVRFLKRWTPDRFHAGGFSDELKDRNIVFRLSSEHSFIHERPAARELWHKLYEPDVIGEGICLITGERSQIARLHPPISGFENPARIVSFDKDNDAFASLGKLQGANAPTSIEAAFNYTAVINRFLSRGSGHRMQIGDASTLFWADASDAPAVEAAEGLFAALLGAESIDESVEAKKIGAILEALRQGKPLEALTPDLPQGVRFYVLALSPNAARLSVRFFIEDDFREIAKRYLEHIGRLRIEPPPREPTPSVRRLLLETASQRESKNIPPQLAGDWLRSILTGAPYPLTLLSTLLMRLRADHDVNALRAAIIKAVLIRNFDMKKEAPVALDPDNNDPGYLLGRLFAVIEKTQLLALGKVNASIKDRYYGSASATPRNVFPLLLRMNAHHQSKAAVKSEGLSGYFANQLSEVMDKLPCEFPATLNLQRQGAFALGYFHQMSRRKAAEGEAPATMHEE